VRSPSVVAPNFDARELHADAEVVAGAGRNTADFGPLLPKRPISGRALASARPKMSKPAVDLRIPRFLGDRWCTISRRLSVT
jgi:hypothetical protein